MRYINLRFTYLLTYRLVNVTTRPVDRLLTRSWKSSLSALDETVEVSRPGRE